MGRYGLKPPATSSVAAVLLSLVSAEVLVIQVKRQGNAVRDAPLQSLACEAVPSNWNIAIDDQGSQGAFAGVLHLFESKDTGDIEDTACSLSESAGAQGKLVLVDADAASRCGGFVVMAKRAAERGARGVVFYAGEDEPGPTGIALGDVEPPPIRAVMIERRHGQSARRMLFEESGVSTGEVTAELRAGLLISEDAYEEHFIFRVDEMLSTRSANFLWSAYPEMLSRSGRKPLSSRLGEMVTSFPSGWFSDPAPPFVPLFNPSLLTLPDGSLLASLRMSNGPGCPSVRRSRQSSMDTRVFRNGLVLAHLDAATLDVMSHVDVEFPPLVCMFRSDTKLSGRQFLDEVHGPMDARIIRSGGAVDAAAEELWVTFYAERNIPHSQEVHRGIHAAPLYVDWQPCANVSSSDPSTGDATRDDIDDIATADSSRTASDWEMLGEDVVFTGTGVGSGGCMWLRMGDVTSLESCHKSCDSTTTCNAVNFRAGHACVLRACPLALGNVDAVAGAGMPTERLAGWQAWRRRPCPFRWRQAPEGVSPRSTLLRDCRFLAVGSGSSDLDACRASCEASTDCGAILFSQVRGSCFLHRCGVSGGIVQGDVPYLSEWEGWRWAPDETEHERSNMRGRSLNRCGSENGSSRPSVGHGSSGGDSPPPTTPSARCLSRAWVEANEIIIFPAESGVEKNWNLIHASRQRLLIEYFVEPHLVMEAGLVGGGGTDGLHLATLGITESAKWPYEVLHGLTNVRGGYCCVELSDHIWRGRLQEIDGRAEPLTGPLLLGCGHLQRIRSPFDQAKGDIDRFRRQAKSRTYHNFFYLIRSKPPYDMVAVSTEWCISMNGHFSEPWRSVLADGEEACEAIQFASGLALRSGPRGGEQEVVIAYGINDCEADIITMPLSRLFALLKPLVSDTNFSLDDLGQI
eukprot:TRINITY_DN75793_c0_g1_i1.p1 TRINITY_DN75793_c0_g1~~TRINITY_DN75793_c0_g1_i1.p1  ORF type:complete len:915 (+),score=122.45 TRINITY_DN75793_c0_g1_i1:77-2821(+)